MNSNPAETLGTCKATIAICTYNRIETLPRTLGSLSKLNGPYTFEVLVVNGPSNDGTAEYLATRDDIRVLENPEVNLSVSRNIAIANAKGEYIAFIDDDAVPEQDWLSLLVERLDQDNGLSAAGGFIRDANGISFQAKYVFCDVFGTGYHCENPDYATFLGKEKRLYPSLTGTNVLFRREDLLKIGGFDEVFAYFLDETDVNKRMDDLDMRSAVLPEAEIHHKYAPSHLRTSGNVSKNMYPISRSVAYFAMKHGIAEVGWDRIATHLKQFYKNEFIWKRETLANGRLTTKDFEQLMFQVKMGIMDGVDRYFDSAEAPTHRLDKHARTGPPVIRRMRPGDDALRLCMLSQDHARTSRGGIGRWTHLVARGLSEKGHDVTVIGEADPNASHEFCDYTDAGYWSHNIRNFEREAGNETDCLGLPKTLGNASKRKLTELRRVMPRRRFDVASAPIWDVEGAALIGSGELPTVLSLHTCAGLMLDSKPEWRENETFYKEHVLRVINAEIQALRRSTMILANSRAIMRDISELYGLDLFERPHAVVPHGIEDVADPEGAFASRRKAGSPTRILFLGRLETRKGVEHMVSVSRRLLQEGADIEVEIVGGSVDERNLQRVQQLVRDFPEQVRWHGFLSEEKLDTLMRSVDIFLGPSLYESFGLIYIEAMRYHIPCVAFDTGGVGEVIEHGVDGFLAPLGDEAALFGHLKTLVEQEDLRLKMSQAARKNFVERFLYTEMADQLLNVYRAASEMHGTGRLTAPVRS